MNINIYNVYTYKYLYIYTNIYKGYDIQCKPTIAYMLSIKLLWLALCIELLILAYPNL